MPRVTAYPHALEKIAAFITLPRINKLLSTLIGIPSPSGEEAAALRFIEAYLREHGVGVKRQSVTKNRYNILVRGGNPSQPSVLLNTHVDTVPSYTAANSVARRAGNTIYGRGSCDAKGSVAAMLLAFVAIHRSSDGGQVPVDLCFTVGEENSGDGSQRFVQDCRKYVWAIVGEPTDLRIVNCHAGYVEIVLAASSVRSHAFDPAGEQAIIAVADLMLEIKRQSRRYGKKPVHTFVHWIEGGDRSPFWSGGSPCKAALVVNTYSKAEIASTIRLARTCCAAVARKHPGVEIEVQIEGSDEGLETPRNSPVIGYLSASLRAIGRDRRIAALPSWTDGARLYAAGIPTVVFGPGSLKDAHTLQEKVNIKDVRDASLAIAGAIMNWHGQSHGREN
jgi:acetylornithine deacetylase/succinyl-diaminopimelate desuccinylase-like protein